MVWNGARWESVASVGVIRFDVDIYTPKFNSGRN
jgi:hypothetical protein